MTWYMRGQSNYDNGNNFHMGLYFDVNGFASGDYVTLVMPDDVSQGDPFMTVAASTQPWNPGSQELEFGLWDHYRIKVSASGIHGWHYASGDWFDLLAEGGASQLSELSDVSSVVYTTGYVLRANGTGYVSAQLAHGDLSDAPTSAHHVRYADSEAIQAVEDVGLVLSATKLITSADENLDFIFGKTRIGSTISGLGGYAVFANRTMTSVSQYALIQNPTFLTILNAGSEQSISHRIANVEKMNMDASALTMSVPIAMGTNKITGLANGVDAQDAMAFGQKYTDANAVSAVATADDYLKNDANDVMNGDLTVNNLITAGLVDSVNVSDKDANSIKGITIDDADIANNKILKYNSTSGNLEYETDDTGAGFAPPIGFIAMFSGAWTDNSTILGWYACTLANAAHGVPNLENKFIRGSATSGGSGGSDDAVVVSHTHNSMDEYYSGSLRRNVSSLDVGEIAQSGQIQATGVSGTGKNIPAYYALIFIMRVN